MVLHSPYQLFIAYPILGHVKQQYQNSGGRKGYVYGILKDIEADPLGASTPSLRPSTVPINPIHVNGEEGVLSVYICVVVCIHSKGGGQLDVNCDYIVFSMRGVILLTVFQVVNPYSMPLP